MDEKMLLTKKEQVDLVTDPLGLSILNIIGVKEPRTVKYIAEELGEKEDLIHRYLHELCQYGLVVKDEEEHGEVRYLNAAQSFETDKKMLNEYSQYWISGTLNHVENEFSELLTLTAGSDWNELFADLGYQDPKVYSSTVKLTQTQLDTFMKSFKELLEGDQDESEDARQYSLVFIMQPTVNEFKKKLKNKTE